MPCGRFRGGSGAVLGNVEVLEGRGVLNGICRFRGLFRGVLFSQQDFDLLRRASDFI